MKSIKLVLLSFLMLCALPHVVAQSSEVSSEIISALDKGDAAKLSAYLNANVELVVGNKNDVFSKQQATGIITDFFRTNKVSSFQLLHKGNKEATSFAIGEIKTNTGNYRVYVLTRKSGNQTVIQQLRIEISND
ncbi:MAG: DUF4783 domain-containing protein [Paludibacter sp.]|nr:DUF4783 domain-containing protein [Paludibacter sp.]MBP6634892.1 DUF4783 domain-containing protein [Paludibacter sp.]